MYLYGDQGLSALAYFIIPDENGEIIHHQYGCVCCNQFEIKGRIEEIPEELALKLNDVLDCNCFCKTIEEINKITGLEFDIVLGEALGRLKDDRYVAICNCD